jgi:nucleoside-diphosphate-sugar epimerase
VKVLVTGGSGLLGSHVIAALVARGDRVRALVRESTGAQQAVAASGAEAVPGDVTDASAWSRGVAGMDGIVHAAALVLKHASLETFRGINVGATELALEAAGRARIPLVHISSVSVYGRDAAFAEGGGRVSEDFPFQPIPDYDFYARTKREAELLARRVAEERGMAVTAIRPNVLFGERDRYFSPRVARALRYGFLPRVGPGDNHLSCVYAGNVAAAVLPALDRPVPGFRAFNTTNDSDLTQRQFFDAFAAALGARPWAIPVPVALASLAVKGFTSARAWLSPRTYPGAGHAAIAFLTGENPYRSDRARAELGWRPPTPALDAIARTGVWLRQNERPG